MSVGLLLNNALTGLSTNQSALTHVSNNVANVNNPDYARRIVQQEAIVLDGQGAGVGIAAVQRAVDSFFAEQSIAVKGDVGRFETEARVHDRIQSLFGQPDDPNSFPGRVNSALAAVADVLVDPGSAPRRTTYLSELEQLTDGFATLSDQLTGIRSDVNAEISGLVDAANNAIQRIDELNREIRRLVFDGSDTTGLLDERDAILKELGGYLDIETRDQGDGTVHVTTGTGFPLVGTGVATLSYASPAAVTADTVFPPIEVTRATSTGTTIDRVEILDPQISGGTLKGLLQMRDQDIPKLGEQIGELAGVIADKFNAAHNDSIAVPPRSALTGRQTGLVATDSLNFTGRTTLAIVDTAGALVGEIALDFDAGTYSVNGGAATPLGATIGDLATNLDTALDAALGTNGNVSFANGVLSIDTGATGHGVGFLQDTVAPSARAGRGFSHFFGLNDLMRAHQPAHVDTGLQGTDAHGFTAGQTIDLVVRSADGAALRTATVTISGTTFNDVLTDLNNVATGLGTTVVFSLDANGRLITTPQPGFEGAEVDVVADNTTRTSSGVSLSDLFGIGAGPQIERARDLAIVPEIAGDQTRLALAKLDLSPATVIGDTVASPGDNRGGLALQSVTTSNFVFGAAGDARATTTTISNYTAILTGDAAARAAAVNQQADTAVALDAEITGRLSEVQGVNLDEELSNMIIYQQAYNASARMLTTAQELFDQILRIV